MPKHDFVRIDLPGTNKYLNVLSAAIAEFMVRACTADDALIYNIQLATQEICTNIVDHAYANSDNQRIILTLEMREAGELIIIITDKGKPFNSTLDDDTLPPEAQVRGYGLHLVKSLIDNVTYVRKDDMNLWTLTHQT